MASTALEWTLWKRQVYFSSRTALAKSPGTTDCIFDIPTGVFPPVEDPARLVMRIRRFQIPFLWGTFNKNGVPGNEFIVKEYLSGVLVKTTTIDIFEGTPAQIPYIFLNGIALADRLNTLFAVKLQHDYNVSYDTNSAYIRYYTSTPDATFVFDFVNVSNPCAPPMGFRRNTITTETNELFTTQPILSQGFLALNIRFPQLSGGNWADNDETQPLHPSAVFARIPLDDRYTGLNYLSQTFETQFLIGNSEVIDGTELRIQITTERPGEFVPLPDGIFWNIELEFSAQIPAYLQLLTLGQPSTPQMIEDQDKQKQKDKGKKE